MIWNSEGRRELGKVKFFHRGPFIQNCEQPWTLAAAISDSIRVAQLSKKQQRLITTSINQL